MDIVLGCPLNSQMTIAFNKVLFGSGWQLIQRLTTGQSAKNVIATNVLHPAGSPGLGFFCPPVP